MTGFQFSWEALTKRSKVWRETWEVVSKLKGEPALMCKHCKHTVPHPALNKNRNTSGGVRHLESCTTYQATLRPVASTEAERNEFWRQRSSMTRSNLCDLVLRIIIAGDLPFRFAENPALLNFLKISYPQIQRPTERMIAMHFSDEAEACRMTLRDLFAEHTGKFSLALDGWNSRDNKDFLGICPSKAMYRDDRRFGGLQVWCPIRGCLYRAAHG